MTQHSDPAVYAQGISDVSPGLVRAIGLDLSLSCGVAMLDFDPAKPVMSNSLFLDLWNLDVGAFDSSIVRFVRLRQFLAVVKPHAIFFEEAKVSPSGVGTIHMQLVRMATSTELQAALKTSVSLWAQDRGVVCAGISSTELKKWATGKGNASKEAMVAACNKKFGTELPVEDCEKFRSDDLADAAHVLDWGIANYGKGL